MLARALFDDTCFGVNYTDVRVITMRTNSIKTSTARQLMLLILFVFLAPINLIAVENLNHRSPVAVTPGAPPVATLELQRNAALASQILLTKGTALPSLPSAFGLRGVLIETVDRQLVLEQSADQTFNPASCVKLATALAALRSFGANYRYNTGVWTNGTFDKSTGTITGDLIISGRDPSFHWEHAVMLAQELNRLGIKTVTGDLIVGPSFTMDFDMSAQRSGNYLYDTLDASQVDVCDASLD